MAKTVKVKASRRAKAHTRTIRSVKVGSVLRSVDKRMLNWKNSLNRQGQLQRVRMKLAQELQGRISSPTTARQAGQNWNRSRAVQGY